MKNLLYFICFSYCCFSFGQAQVDVNFNSTDLGFYNGDGKNSIVNFSVYSPIKKLELLPDGRLLYTGSDSSLLKMLNADGTDNVSFNANATAVLNHNSAFVTDFGYQSDGKIIVIGYINQRPIVRLNTDGTIDATFNALGVPNLKDFVIQSDGKIVAVGQFTSVEGISMPCNNICRLNADGSIDTTFNIGGSGALFGNGNSNINTVELLANGKILILGNFGGYNNVPRNNIAVLNQDGTLDTTFNPGSSFVYEFGNSSSLKFLGLQSNGKFYLSGGFSTYNGTTVNRLIRVNPDGSLDTTFSTGTGFQFSYAGPISGGLFYDEGEIYAMIIQSDGKLVVGGKFESYNGSYHRNIMRLNADGAIDASFHDTMGTCNDRPVVYETQRWGEVTKMVQYPDGKIIIGGGFNWYNYALTGNLARISANGDLDLTFNPGTGFNNTVTSTAVLPDGKIMVAGNFSKYFGVDKKGVARLNTDGSLDMSFNTGTGVEGLLRTGYQGLGFSQYVNAMAIQPNDSKVLIGGGFKSFNGVPKNSFVRLNTNGSVDTTFNVPIIGSDTFNNVSMIQVLSNGKILTIINGNLLRLNTNGTVDASFAPIAATSFMLMPDGRFYVLESYTTLKRYLSNGAVDTSFTTVSITSSYNDTVIAQQSDGRVVIAGSFTAINNMSINKLARINTDGTLDMTFYPSISFNPSLIKIIPNDKILLGERNNTNNQEVKLYKLLANGTLESIYTDFGLNDWPTYNTILSSITLDEGKVYLGGSFASVNGVGRNRLVRLLDSSITLSVNQQNGIDLVKLYPNPTRNLLTIDTPNNFVLDKVEVYNNLGQLVLESANIAQAGSLDVSALQSGVYFIKLDVAGQQVTRKFLKE